MVDTRGDEQKGIEIWRLVEEKLRELGIDLTYCCEEPGVPPRAKMMCVTPDFKARVQELGQTSRDQAVMVRVDEETLRRLDAWVETGAVKSRSEAAALFIREGLAVRAPELERLGGALSEVEKAKSRLREAARRVVGEMTSRNENTDRG